MTHMAIILFFRSRFTPLIHGSRSVNLNWAVRIISCIFDVCARSRPRMWPTCLHLWERRLAGHFFMADRQLRATLLFTLLGQPAISAQSWEICLITDRLESLELISCGACCWCEGEKVDRTQESPKERSFSELSSLLNSREPSPFPSLLQ